MIQIRCSTRAGFIKIPVHTQLYDEHITRNWVKFSIFKNMFGMLLQANLSYTWYYKQETHYLKALRRCNCFVFEQNGILKSDCVERPIRINMVVFVLIMIRTLSKHVSWIVPKRLAVLLLDFTTEVGVTFSSFLRQPHPLAQMGTTHTLDPLSANRMPELLKTAIQMHSARSKYNPVSINDYKY